MVVGSNPTVPTQKRETEMACMGPNLKYVEQQAIEANRCVWKFLHDSYGVLPGSKYGVNDPEKFHKMKELLKDIFKEDACNGF